MFQWDANNVAPFLFFLSKRYLMKEKKPNIYPLKSCRWKALCDPLRHCAGMKGCQSHLSGIVCKTTLGKSPVVALSWEGCVWVCGPTPWEWLPWVSWSSDLHPEGVWPCSRVLKTKESKSFCWCQQINVLCQIQRTRREWRLNGDFSSSHLFETCSLGLILLRGMKRTRVVVVKHSVHTACGRKHKNLRAMFSATINWQMFLTSAAPKLVYIRWGCSPWLLNCEE